MRTWQDPWYYNNRINKPKSTNKTEILEFYESQVSSNSIKIKILDILSNVHDLMRNNPLHLFLKNC